MYDWFARLTTTNVHEFNPTNAQSVSASTGLQYTGHTIVGVDARGVVALRPSSPQPKGRSSNNIHALDVAKDRDPKRAIS